MQKQTNTTKKLDQIIKFLSGELEPEYKPKVHQVLVSVDGAEISVNGIKMDLQQYEAWKLTVHEKDIVFVTELQNYSSSELAYEVAVTEGINTDGFACDVLKETRKYLKDQDAIATTNKENNGKAKKKQKGGILKSVSDVVRKPTEPASTPQTEIEPYETRRLKRVRFLDPNNLSGGFDPQRDWLF